MRIKQRIEKIPGGMMIVPLFIGTLTRAIYPNPVEPTAFLPGFTGHYLTGTSVILFVFFFCVGTTINLKSSGYIAKKGLSLLISKVILAGVLGVIIGHLLPTEGITSGLFAGLSALAVIASFNETNGGLYMALMTSLKRDEDAAGFPFISIESGPFMTMITMGIAGMAQFPVTALISTLIPFALGIMLGSLDQDFRKFFGPAVPVLIPFFAFTLGFSINLGAIVQSGFMGILMGVAVVAISGGVLSIVDRFVTGSDGVAGWAASSTAGAAVAVPTAIADMAPKFAPIAVNATAIVATSVLVSSILTPLVTMYFEKRARKLGRPIVPTKH
ncbi:MAG: 2-keto-3-deoxygluconate permease [Lactobacillaceae bacterium]|jgi:2-keto-3-deoxygluconate permease|nr:2-keto-3-deoxygluconate permease [Lactobacillaceae bacterium]